jgi:hypothetical protein
MKSDSQATEDTKRAAWASTTRTMSSDEMDQDCRCGLGPMLEREHQTSSRRSEVIDDFPLKNTNNFMFIKYFYYFLNLHSLLPDFIQIKLCVWMGWAGATRAENCMKIRRKPKPQFYKMCITHLIPSKNGNIYHGHSCYSWPSLVWFDFSTENRGTFSYFYNKIQVTSKDGQLFVRAFFANSVDSIFRSNNYCHDKSYQKTIHSECNIETKQRHWGIGLCRTA